MVRSELTPRAATPGTRPSPRALDLRVPVGDLPAALRGVDASAFPRIPGIFVVTAACTISVKASDVVRADARR